MSAVYKALKAMSYAGKVFCPFCGDSHKPTGEFTQCDRSNAEIARFKVAATCLQPYPVDSER